MVAKPIKSVEFSLYNDPGLNKNNVHSIGENVVRPKSISMNDKTQQLSGKRLTYDLICILLARK